MCFILFFFGTYSNQRPATKGVFSLILPLFFSKPYQKGCFILFLHLFLPKLCHKGCFLYFCPYSNQSSHKKGVFLYVCPYGTKVLPKCVFHSFFFALFLTKALPKKGVFLYVCPYSYQSPAKKGVNSILALILTKAMPQRVFILDYFVLILNKALPKCKYGFKDQESIQSSITTDPGYKWESNILTVRHHKREQRGQPFPSR